MDEMTRIGVIGIALPGVIALVGGLALLRRDRPTRALRAARDDAREMLTLLPTPSGVGLLASAGGAMVLATGAYVAHVGVFGSIEGAASNGNDRLRVAVVLLAGIALIASVFIHLARPRAGLWVAVWAGFAGLVGVLTALWPGLKLGGSMDWTTRAITLCLSVVGAIVLAWPIELLVRGRARVSAAIIVAGLSLAIAGGLIGSGSAVLGQFGLGVGMACAGLMAALVFWRLWAMRRSAARGDDHRSSGIGGAALVLWAGLGTALLASGHAYSSLEPWTAFGLALVPSAGWCLWRFIGPRVSPWLRAGAAVLVAALLAGACIAPGLKGLLHWDQANSKNPYSDLGK